MQRARGRTWSAGAALAGLTCLALSAGCEDSRVVATLGELVAMPDPVVFGETPVSTLRTQDVVLQNQGTGAVHLLGLEVSEDPEDFSLSVPPELTLPAAITPGNQVTFSVRYHPQAYPEQDAGVVRLTSTDKGAPEYDLRLSGTAVEPILLVQPVPVQFADTRVLSTSPVTLTITHTGSDPDPVVVSFLGLTDDGEGDFGVQSPPDVPLTLTAGQEQRLHLTYTPQALDDADQGTLTLESDADSQEHLEVPLSGASFGPHIEVSTTALNFGTVSEGANPSLPISISNSGNQELHVTALELSDTGSQKFELAPASVPDPIQPGGSVQVLVTYLADDRGDDDGTLRILHDDPLERPVFVQLHGRTPEPDVFVKPVLISFQLSGTSQTQSKDIRVFNLGDEDLVVTGYRFDNPDGLFSLDVEPSFPATVEPGADPAGPYAEFIVSYNPSGPGQSECQLTILTDDQDEPETPVHLTGSYSP
ncbi:MAG TPA: choice-of-anchor D domain-containing protein [Myxococcota bacterium]|nr:choice-of-anchor D domain-containing protein [Myxococcota bacterium]HRY92533.1 choice-of-anchor D domain-containing protein [Myxococcota bacterium]HSA22061.1 choice-of-anchor D domain-containing protein [Myxococcota bacterium]